MKHEGPTLESLTRRLSEVPVDFLAEPGGHAIGAGRVSVVAVAADLLRIHGCMPPLGRLGALTDSGRNHQQVALLVCWLLADEFFLGEGRNAASDADRLAGLLTDSAAELAEHTASRKFVDDVERREELARFALARLDLRPLGETQAQAEDRLNGLSQAERARVMAASRAAEERARQLRDALRRKAAEESADKWTRE